MSEKQILVVQKHPGQQASIEPLLENTLEAFQKFVGGHIEVVSVCQDLVIVCNEEGRLLNLPYNTNVCGFDFYDPILAVGVKGPEFASVPSSLVNFVRGCLNAMGGGASEHE